MRAVCRVRFLLAAILYVAISSPCVAADTVIFVVRHAEKAAGNGDVALSAEGTKRANQLMETLQYLRVDAIYHTNVIRTKETAQPLATKLGVTPIVYADPTQAWVDSVVETQKGKRALIVGHSNTVHEIVSRLTGKSIEEIGDRFDNLFIVVISDADKSSVRLTYGDVH